MEYRIDMLWDPEAAVWVATSEDAAMSMIRTMDKEMGGEIDLFFYNSVAFNTIGVNEKEISFDSTGRKISEEAARRDLFEHHGVTADMIYNQSLNKEPDMEIQM